MKGNFSVRGFSLIELMVVLAIVGMVMTLVTANLDFLVPSSRLGAGARSLASTLILAHNQAAINGEDAILSYHIDKQTYQLILIRDGKKEPFSIWKLPRGVKYQDILAAGEKKKTRGIFQVYLSPTGIVRGHVIHLKNQEGDTLTIEVNPLSGTVDVLDGYRPLDFVEKP